MSTALEELERKAQGCTACRLAEDRTTVVFSRGTAASGLMVVGEGPGAEEDRQGLPFVGRSGQLLDRLVAEEIGLSRDAFYVANTVKCRPPGNRDPRPDEIETCRPYLDQQIDLLRPRVIMTLGNFASKLLLDTTIGITRLRGHAYRYAHRVLIPTLHPAAVLRGGGPAMAHARADFVRAKMALAGTVTVEEVVPR